MHQIHLELEAKGWYRLASVTLRLETRPPLAKRIQADTIIPPAPQGTRSGEEIMEYLRQLAPVACAAATLLAEAEERAEYPSTTDQSAAERVSIHVDGWLAGVPRSCRPPLLGIAHGTGVVRSGAGTLL